MKEFNCTTKEIISLTQEIYRIRIVPDNNRLFDFRGGQYILLHMSNDRRIPLSIASAPEEKSFIELHVRLIEGHPLAEEMVELFKTADSFQVEGAYGSCYLNDNNRSIVIIAGGTGFSPMKSMIESAFAKNIQRPIELFLGAQTSTELYQHQLINEWQNSYSNFSYTPVIVETEDSWQGAIGFPHEHALKSTKEELRTKDYYISGSEPMVMAVYNALLEKGVEKAQIHSDILNIKRENGELD